MAQFITWRLHDSLPLAVLARIRADLRDLPPDQANREWARAIGIELDKGLGSCLLRSPDLANIVQRSIVQDHEVHYRLHAWVVMPNHVHCLLTPLASTPIGMIVQRLKGSTAQKINKALGRTGSVWQRDYFDRSMLDQTHFRRTMEYIEWNPVKAKLCDDPLAWPFSSARWEGREP